MKDLNYVTNLPVNLSHIGKRDRQSPTHTYIGGRGMVLDHFKLLETLMSIDIWYLLKWALKIKQYFPQ